jgi:predicted alpha-1,6-mannanase (GH76 family)
VFYLDDNEWLAQDLLDWDSLRQDRAVRRKAIDIFGAVVHAWDTGSSNACPGGVYWTTTAAGVVERNTVSTVNAAVVGLRLYQLTRAPSYLHWSRRMLDWVDSCMLAPNGLYADHIDGTGTTDETQWSYNQGSAIAALVLLYLVTGEQNALARAEQIANTTLVYFQDRWSAAEPAVFASIFFRGLLQLAAVDKRGAYVSAAQAYADNAWASARDASTGLFVFTRPTRLLDQAGLTGLYAALARAGGVAAAP